jgi:hypothetical protein
VLSGGPKENRRNACLQFSTRKQIPPPNHPTGLPKAAPICRELPVTNYRRGTPQLFYAEGIDIQSPASSRGFRALQGRLPSPSMTPRGAVWG